MLQFSAHVRVEVPFAGGAASDDGDSDGDGGDDSEEDAEGLQASQPRAPAVAPPFDLESFTVAVRDIQRINGATYISSALRCVSSAIASHHIDRRSAHPSERVAPRSKAAAMFTECSAARRCAVLLTDGRVSAVEAGAAAVEAAAQAGAGVEHFALGVGRGVDSDALMRIITTGATPEGGALARKAALAAASQHTAREPLTHGRAQLRSATFRCARAVTRSGDAARRS